MKMIFVGAGPGDPDLLTVKARRLLESARCCIYAGSLVAPEVIGLLPPDCGKHDSAGMTLEQILDVARECAAEDIDVIRLHTGDPSLYGAINEQMRALDAHGIDYEIVPGVSSFQAAAAALRTELTAPEIAQTVILTRTSGRTPLPPEQELKHLAPTKATLCLFLSTQKLAEVCYTLRPHYGDDCPAALVYHASWPDQKVFRGTLSNLPEKTKGLTRTAMIVVGRALAREGADSKLYDGAFTHGYREGSDS